MHSPFASSLPLASELLPGARTAADGAQTGRHRHAGHLKSPSEPALRSQLAISRIAVDETSAESSAPHESKAGVVLHGLTRRKRPVGPTRATGYCRCPSQHSKHLGGSISGGHRPVAPTAGRRGVPPARGFARTATWLCPLAASPGRPCDPRPSLARRPRRRAGRSPAAPGDAGETTRRCRRAPGPCVWPNRGPPPLRRRASTEDRRARGGTGRRREPWRARSADAARQTGPRRPPRSPWHNRQAGP